MGSVLINYHFGWKNKRDNFKISTFLQTCIIQKPSQSAIIQDTTTVCVEFPYTAIKWKSFSPLYDM